MDSDQLFVICGARCESVASVNQERNFSIFS